MQNEITDPAKLERLISMIEGENWSGMDVDVKGEIYEGLLARYAEDVRGGAGQYFTPRPVIRAIVKSQAPLLADIHELIQATRERLAQSVNAGLVMLYWQIGQRIRKDILKEKRAEYGEQIVSALGTQLTGEFGEGFGKRNLFRMIRFAEVFPDLEIVSALRAQLGWTHFRQIIPLNDPLKRDFYAEMACTFAKWPKPR